MFPIGVVSSSGISNMNGRVQKTPIADLTFGTYSGGEDHIRNKLACLYRLVDLHSWSQSIYNHITVRLAASERDEILINPFGLLYHEITAASLIKVNLDGDVLDPGNTGLGINQAGYILHSALHAARPDVQVIVHLHVPSVAAVASMKCGLLPICQEAMIVGEVAYHDYQGILVDANEKASLTKDLGSKNVMLLRNHGFVVCASSIEKAFLLTYHLIIACETQVKAFAAGFNGINVPSAEAAHRAFHTASGGGGGVNRQADGHVETTKWGVGELEWEAYMRTLDNMNLGTGHQYRRAIAVLYSPDIVVTSITVNMKALRFFCLILLISVVHAEIGCEANWHAFGQHCYRHYLGKPVTFDEANEICVSNGGHLASINTVEESAFIFNISSTGGQFPFDGQPWVGFKKLNKKWQWIDGSTGSGVQWAPGEPDNNRGNEWCVKYVPDMAMDNAMKIRYYKGKTNVLNDVPCERATTRFICKKPQHVIPKPLIQARIAAVPNDIDCENGWKGLSSTGFCYKHFSDSSVTQAGAEAICEQQGGHLTSITSEEELCFVSELSKTGKICEFDDQPWIGLVKSMCGKWSWTDGEDRKVIKWAPGEPNGNFDSDEKCVKLVVDVAVNSRNEVVYNNLTEVLNDVPCDRTSTRFICKRLLAFKPKIQVRPPLPTVPIPECPKNAEKVSGNCVCVKGSVDIRDTDFPEKDNYEHGEVCIPKNPCQEVDIPISIVFVVDSSGSIGDDWVYVLEFLKNAAEIVPKSSHVGFVKYSNDVSASLWLPNPWTEEQFANSIPAEHDQGLTNTPAGLKKAQEMLQKDNHKSKIVVLVTDGIPQIEGYSLARANEMSIAAVNELDKDDIKIFIMGIGQYIKSAANSIKSWVKKPEDYFPYHQSISMLTNLHMRNVLMKVCDQDQIREYLNHPKAI